MKKDFFKLEPTEVAQRLIGATLLIEGVGGTIVETEAYRHDDPASHSFKGPSNRNRVMFGPVGVAYVYKIYGIHWCLNMVCGLEPGSAVLIRALEPHSGFNLMRERRGQSDVMTLCSGPGKLAQALGVNGFLNGNSLQQPPFRIELCKPTAPVIAGPRIGISKATELSWRFGLLGSAFISRPFVD